jgi:hypothetical protein
MKKKEQKGTKIPIIHEKKNVSRVAAANPLYYLTGLCLFMPSLSFLTFCFILHRIRSVGNVLLARDVGW